MPEPISQASDKQLLDAVAGLHTTLEDRWKAVEVELKAGADRDAAINVEVDKLQKQFTEVENVRRARAHSLPSDSPLSEEVGNRLSDRAGWKSLTGAKLLSLESSHPIIRDTDRDTIKTMQDYHDACVVRFWILQHKYGAIEGAQAVRDRLMQTIDFKTYVDILDRHGFGKSDDMNSAFKSGTDKHVKMSWDAETDGMRKANEIANPAGGYGANFDFTLLSGQLIEKMRLDLVVAAQFKRIVLTRTHQEIPALSADAMGVWGAGTTMHIPPDEKLGSGTSPSVPWPSFASPNFYSDLASKKVRFDAEPLLCFLIWNDDMEDDSIIPFIPLMRDEAAYGAARALDRSILDGDITATHRDNDVTATNDFRKAFIGLNAMAVNYDIDNSGGTFDVDDLHAMRASLGIYGMNPGRPVTILPLKVWFQIVGAAGASAGTNAQAITRADAMGGAERATLNTGVVGKVWGTDVVVSEFQRVDVDATGVRGASGNTKSRISMSARDRFAWGQRGETRIETTRFAPILTNIIQCAMRVDFQPWDQSALTTGVLSTGLTDIPTNTTFNNA